MSNDRYSKPKKKVVEFNRKEATMFQMLEYLCSKVNWGKSAIDADAVWCMNTLFMELRKDKRKVYFE